MNQFDLDKKAQETGLKEECGVFGIYDCDGNDVASTVYYGLFAMQHRGQESAGIAVTDTNGPKGLVQSHKGMGLANEVFDGESLAKLHGNMGVDACPFKGHPCVDKGLFEKAVVEVYIVPQ